MEFLTTATQSSHAGYPIIVFYLIAFIGLVLIIIRPQTAFLFAVFCLAAKNYHAAVFSRTPFFGPYLNLNDLLLWIALLAMVIKYLRERKKVWAPEVLLVIFLIVLIGDFQSLFKYGTNYQVQKRIWSTAIFPIMFLVGANMIQSEKQATDFYKVLFLGLVLASIQHMYFIFFKQNVIDNYTGYAQIRTISYIMSGGASILIGSIFAGHSEIFGHFKKAFYYMGLALIGLSILLSFTRGLWIIMSVTVVILPFLIQKKFLFKMSVKRYAIIVSLGAVVALLIFPKLQLAEQINERFKTMTSIESLRQSYLSRELGQKEELKLWLKGSIILGHGSVLPVDILSKREIAAYYHVAYSTYLAHYGLLGMIIYQILLPLLTIKVGRKHYFMYIKTGGGIVSLIGITCSVMYIIGFLTSIHYLLPTTHIYGLFYGAVWGLSRGDKMRKSVSLDPNRNLKLTS